jgi:hypothetical protein
MPDPSMEGMELLAALHLLPDTGPEADDWHCRRCGSPRWVSASLNGGYTRTRQCVPCGYYSGDILPDTEEGERG